MPIFSSFQIETVVMVLLLGLGVCLTLRTRFFPLWGLRFIAKSLAEAFSGDSGATKSISPFQAVATALAGTMGVGNLVGVATALVSGGPGAIFWMWVSAFFGMATKYAEVFLAVKYRRKNKSGGFCGGPMVYMADGLGRRGSAVLFCIFCVLCSFGIGNLTQVHSVATSLQAAFRLPLWVSGAAVCLCVGAIILGGVRRIARAAEIVIPVISILYLCISGAFLWLNRAYLAEAIALIFRCAIGWRQTGGGILGYHVSQAVRFGLTRGVFTNEAGLGSSPIAHAAAQAKSPAQQGSLGIFEVFFDTIVVCTVTALVLLTADGGRLWQTGLDGAALTAAAFASQFGVWGSAFVALSLAFFAVPSMLSWCFYGESALSWLWGERKAAIMGYRLLFLVCIWVGSFLHSQTVWALADSLNALMALPNMLALFLLRRQITVPTRNSELKKSVFMPKSNPEWRG